MDDATAHRTRELFELALTVPAEGRASWLERACAGNEELRAQVQALLRADAQVATGCESPSFSVASPGRSWVGREIDGFRVLELLGAGGMGRVFAAEQLEPRRRVALKFFDPLLGGPGAEARFHQEAQLLATLDHPAIAKIHAVGVCTDQGTSIPYLALELIAGARPITEFVRHSRLGTHEVLTLFRSVLDGVDHAHRRGVLHRDLKPGNLLVDEEGRPKIIDFGVGRRLEQGEPDALTRTGQIVGTVAYMSPEQCSGQGKLDGRSDVYSLGVVLYELLCERLPYAKLDADPLQMLQRVCNESPVRPSEALRPVRGDLETILLKALEKDPDRRYASVAEFSGDLLRHLREEPILARPPSTLYVLRKFARRHRALCTLGAASALLLLGSTAFALRFAGLESHARQLSERRLASVQKVSGFLQRLLQGGELFTVPNPNATLRESIEYAERSLDERLSDEPTVRGELWAALGHAFLHMGDLPGARMRYEKARDTFRDAPSEGDRDRSAASTEVLIAELDELDGRWSEEAAASLVEKTARILGPDHPDTLHARTIRARLALDQSRFAEAQSQAEALLPRTEPGTPGEKHRGHVAYVYGRATASLPANTLEETDRSRAIAREFFQGEVTRLEGAGSLESRLGSMMLAELARLSQGKEWIGLMERVLDLRGRVFGEDHPETWRARSDLGVARLDQGYFEDAFVLLSGVEDGFARRLGPRHSWTTAALHNLGTCESRLGQFDSALVHLTKAWEQKQELEPSARGLSLAFTDHEIAIVHFRRGERAAALERARAAFEAKRTAWGDGATLTSMARNLVAEILASGEPTASDVDEVREILRQDRAAQPESDYSVVRGRLHLAEILRLVGERAESRAEVNALQVLSQRSGLWTLKAMLRRTEALLLREDDPQEAMRVLDEAVAETERARDDFAKDTRGLPAWRDDRALLEPSDLLIPRLHADRGALLAELGRAQDAVPDLRFASETFAKILGIDHEETRRTAELLVEQLETCEEFDEADVWSERLGL